MTPRNISDDATLAYLFKKNSKEAAAELNEFKASFLNLVYPVGSIYMSVNSASPQTLFGGTWERITGKFLLAATDGGSSGAIQAAGNSGGDATHVHTTGGHTLTTDEIPAHSHTVQTHNNGGSGSVWCIELVSVASKAAFGSGKIGNTGGGRSHSHGNTGSASTMPPYLSVYVWKRTA